MYVCSWALRLRASALAGGCEAPGASAHHVASSPNERRPARPPPSPKTGVTVQTRPTEKMSLPIYDPFGSFQETSRSFYEPFRSFYDPFGSF